MGRGTSSARARVTATKPNPPDGAPARARQLLFMNKPLGLLLLLLRVSLPHCPLHSGAANQVSRPSVAGGRAMDKAGGDVPGPDVHARPVEIHHRADEMRARQRPAHRGVLCDALAAAAAEADHEDDGRRGPAEVTSERALSPGPKKY